MPIELPAAPKQAAVDQETLASAFDEVAGTGNP